MIPPMNPSMGQPMAPALPMLPKELMDLLKDQIQLQEMLEAPSWDDVEALLRDDVMLGFKIDIETDSTILADQDQEKQSRIELIGAVSGFIQQAQMIQDPTLKVLMARLLEFGVRGFKAGKEIEGTLNLAISKLEKEAQNPPPAPPTPPNPDVIKAQAQMQIEQQKLQSQQAQAQHQAELEMQKEQLKQQTIQQQNSLEAQRSQLDAQIQKELKQQEMQQNAAIQQYKINAELSLKRELAMIEHALHVSENTSEPAPVEPDPMQAHIAMITQSLDALHKHVLAPKKANFIRDAQGNLQSATVVPVTE